MASFIPGIAGHGVREKRLKRLIKVSIVDDNEYDGLSLKRILEQSVGFTCVSLHVSAVEAIDLIPKVNPHLAFLDVRMPGMNGLECTRRLKILMPQLKIVIVSGLLDAETMNQSLRAGADNYLTKPVIADQCLATLIHTVRSGPPATDTSCEIRPCVDLPKDAPKTASLLTTRENEVMVLLAKGFPYKLIADQLMISFSAVNQHLHRIYRKLGATNRTEAVNHWLDRSALGRVG
jgi:DNA-binding NarL/FixJ family response regulator